MTDHDPDQIAFRRLKPTIDGTYPQGRFVAIAGGRILADAASLRELRAQLGDSKDSVMGLIVQAGADYSEIATIFYSEEGRESWSAID